MQHFTDRIAVVTGGGTEVVDRCVAVEAGTWKGRGRTGLGGPIACVGPSARYCCFLGHVSSCRSAAAASHTAYIGPG